MASRIKIKTQVTLETTFYRDDFESETEWLQFLKKAKKRSPKFIDNAIEVLFEEKDDISIYPDKIKIYVL